MECNTTWLKIKMRRCQFSVPSGVTHPVSAPFFFCRLQCSWRRRSSWWRSCPAGKRRRRPPQSTASSRFDRGRPRGEGLFITMALCAFGPPHLLPSSCLDMPAYTAEAILWLVRPVRVNLTFQM